MSPSMFITDEVVLTKRADVFSVVKFTGVDAECLDACEVEGFSRSYDALLRQMGPEFRVYQGYHKLL